jgi:hypothetical protein
LNVGVTLEKDLAGFRVHEKGGPSGQPFVGKVRKSRVGVQGKEGKSEEKQPNAVSYKFQSALASLRK